MLLNDGPPEVVKHRMDVGGIVLDPKNMNRLQDRLFSQGDLSQIASSYPGMVAEKVEAISRDQFLATPEDDLVRHIESMLRIEPLTVYLDDRMRTAQSEIKVDVSGDPMRPTRGDGPCLVSGIRIALGIPFTGDPQLTSYRPHGFYMSPLPCGQVMRNGDGTGQIQMVFDFPSDENEDRIKQRIQEQLNYLKQVVDAQRPYLDQFNSKLADAARAAVRARRNRLARHDKILEHLSIPVQKRPGEPTIQPIPVTKRIITTLPPPPQGGFKAEPGITDDVFDGILAVVRHGGRSFERTPATYAVHDEEELRDIVLSHLNVYYQGGATGETFRKKGKTDILIQDQDRSAFVAECKVWQGAQALQRAIDQLLGYMTWRDCKAAVVLFNKHNSGLSGIQETVSDTFARHARFMKQVPSSETGEWRFFLRSLEDDARLIHCHVFLFNLYVKKHG